MIKNIVKVFLLALLLVNVNTVGAKKLRLMTYNLHHCEGMDKKLDEDRIAKLILNNKPDVIAVQELDSVTKRCPSYQMQVLGEKTNMYYTYARTINYGGGKYGTGMLSKEKPISVKRIPLPGKEPRVLLICEFKDYVYANMHLSLQEENRMASLPIILKEVKNYNKPLFIAGDWNTVPSDEFIKQMGKYFDFVSDTKQFTFSSQNPRECIDYIAIYKGNGKAPKFQVKEFSVIPESVASDHRPLKAVVKFK